MEKPAYHFPSALKHGAYSGTALLPGEDPAAFRKLQDDLVAELTPTGPLEEDIVTTIAQLLWRKQNLATYRLAERANNRHSAICSKYGPRTDVNMALLLGKDLRTAEEIEADAKAEEEQVRKEIGDAMIFVEMGRDITVNRLFEELGVIDRLDSLIDRCIKRLLMVRGVKSLSPSVSSEPATVRKRLPAA